MNVAFSEKGESMPRKNLIRTSHYPYHVVTRSNNKEWFDLPTDLLWERIKKLIQRGKSEFKVQIDAFILMSNHYHMCILTPQANLDKFMYFFNKNISQFIAKHSGRINHSLGGRYKWNLIKNDPYYFNVIRYIYQNPIRAGLCHDPEEYPYSDIEKYADKEEMRDWIKRPISQYDNNKTKKSLRKAVIE